MRDKNEYSGNDELSWCCTFLLVVMIVCAAAIAVLVALG